MGDEKDTILVDATVNATLDVLDRTGFAKNDLENIVIIVIFSRHEKDTILVDATVNATLDVLDRTSFAKNDLENIVIIIGKLIPFYLF